MDFWIYPGGLIRCDICAASDAFEHHKRLVHTLKAIKSEAQLHQAA